MWRQHDVTSWPCLAEELLRCLGFNQIKGNFNHQVLANNMHDPLVDLTDRVQQFFVANGFNELNTYPMISQKDISWLQLKSTDNTTISNPISPEFSVMRPSLLPSFMRILHYHHQRQMSSGAYFEVGRQFKPDGETTTLAMAISDAYMINHYNDAQTKLAKTIFQHGCHHLKRWLSSLSIEATFTETTGPCFAHPHYYQELTVGNNVLGYITTCHPSYLDHYDIATPVIFAEICLDVVLHLCNHTPTYRPFSRFPSTRRDIALVVPKDLTYDTILTFINQYKHKTVVDVGVFDVFKSEQLGPDQTSIGIYFIYQDMATTLADDKVNKAHDRLCKRLVNELPVVIR